MRIRTTKQPDEVIEIQPNEYSAFVKWGIILEVVEDTDCWDCDECDGHEEDTEEAWLDDGGSLYGGSEYTLHNDTGGPLRVLTLEELQEHFQVSSDDESED